MKCSKYSLCLFFLFVFSGNLFTQVKSGKIVYERRTNLYKKFKDDNVKEWIEKDDKNKVDIFELYFNDSLSVFKPQYSDLKEKMSWTTSKNMVYQDLNSNQRLSIKSIWGEQFYLLDTVYKRKWKITESKRSICGYTCRKAILEMNDTTRIYAWFAEDIIPSVGPESFCNLPGAILGLATEDGGVIYFAKTIEILNPDLIILQPKKNRSKIYSSKELKEQLQKDFGKNPWGKAMIKETFFW